MISVVYLSEQSTIYKLLMRTNIPYFSPFEELMDMYQRLSLSGLRTTLPERVTRPLEA